MGSACASGIQKLEEENLEPLPKELKPEAAPPLRSLSRKSNDSSDSGSESDDKIVIRGHEILETLGKGSFGTVKKARNQKTGATFAMKFIFRNEHYRKDVVVREIQAMQKVRSPYVVRLHAYSMNVHYPSESGFRNASLMVMEYAPGGDLYELLFYSHAMEEKLGRTYFHQICDGLLAIHAAGVIHRDLKPQNILVDSNFCLKITDFGHSVIVANPRAVLAGSHFGTKGFRAPEVVLGREYTRSCDVFSLGVILFNIITHRMPFRSACVQDSYYYLIARNTRDDWNTFWNINKSPATPELRSLLEGLLCYQPRHRFSLKQVQEHPWYIQETYPDSALKELMWKTHLAAHEKKLNDPNRAKRLESGAVPEAVQRSTDAEETLVETVSKLDPFALHYELREDASVSKVIRHVKTYMSRFLFAKFKKSGNNCCSGSYKAKITGEETGKLQFEFGVIKRFEKILFFLKIEKTTWLELAQQCETIILDALKSIDCVEGFYAEQRSMSLNPDLENYDFSQLEKEDSLYL